MGLLRRIARKIIRGRSTSSQQREPTKVAPPSQPEQQTDLSNIECTAQELKERLEAGEEVVIIDVREDYEIKQSGIISGALHYPLRELSTRWEELKDANEVVCYCAAGARSYNAAMLLREHGIFNATSMSGGIANWRAIGGSSVAWEG